MFRSILVPLDGSRFSEYALPWAARIARRGHGTLRLVMIHEPASALVPAGTSSPSEESAAKAETLAYLVRTTAHWRSCSGVGVEYQLGEGAACPELVAAVESIGPDLVVMSSHGRGSLGPPFRGSVADEVIRRLVVPILLVRPKDGSEIPPPNVDIGRILVPLDRSPEAEGILGPAGLVSSVTQAHLTLLTVLAPGDRVRAGREAQQYLDRLADGLRARGHRVAARVLVEADPGVTLLRELATGRFDAIALRIRAGHVGAVTDQVIRGSDKPVLLLG